MITYSHYIAKTQVSAYRLDRAEPPILDHLSGMFNNFQNNPIRTIFYFNKRKVPYTMYVSLQVVGYKSIRITNQNQKMSLGPIYAYIFLNWTAYFLNWTIYEKSDI